MPQTRESSDWLDRIEVFTRGINRAFAAIACILVLVIMTLIMVEIFYRYVLHDPIAWVLDITIFLFVFVFFLAVAPALESGSHIEVDLFDPLIPQSARKTQRLIGKALTLIFAAIFFWFVFGVLPRNRERGRIVLYHDHRAIEVHLLDWSDWRLAVPVDCARSVPPVLERPAGGQRRSTPK